MKITPCKIKAGVLLLPVVHAGLFFAFKGRDNSVILLENIAQNAAAH